ncbi:MAG: UDP-N-acetylmuramoyl-tripeptide--D-alanyl-D-alanine ligase [Rhodoferax sp.]
MNLHPEQITQWLRPRHTVGVDARLAPLQRVHTDSRSLQPGDLFVALRGARFDANDFLPQAAAAGAVAALCQGEDAAQRLAQAGLPGWVVDDTRRALAELARRWRAQWAGSALIAVTGSNGKTTVTQMLASILRSAYGAAAHATCGNLNNDIGVPLTVLGLRSAHRAAVVELGMNHPGEIAQLAAVAQPTVALVNNAQREHLEFMHTVQAVAAENGAVLAALPADGVAVFPADDAHVPLWADVAATRRVLRFATQPGVDAEFGLLQAQATPMGWQVRARTPDGALDFSLAIAGAHNLHNALAALACAWGAGVAAPAIAAGLAAFEPVSGRSRTLRLQHEGRALTLVDDSYNANPDSVAAAIELLSALPGPRLLVLGDMGEVGDQGPRFHAEALQHALQKNIEKVLVTGSAFAAAAPEFDAVQAFDDGASLNAAVVAALPGVSSVLVKGSRFMKMERVVAAIQAACAQAPAEAAC